MYNYRLTIYFYYLCHNYYLHCNLGKLMWMGFYINFSACFFHFLHFVLLSCNLTVCTHVKCFDVFYVFYHAWISGVPDPPVILNVTVLSAHSVFLTWNTTSAQSAANYSVEFSNDSFTWKNATCNQSFVREACIVQHSEAMVSWLKPYTNYTFRVAAENSFGRSNYSGESKLILTDEAGNCLPRGIFSFFFVLILIHLPLSTMQCTCITLFENIPVVAHTVGSGLKMKKKRIIISEMIVPSCSMHKQIHACP